MSDSSEEAFTPTVDICIKRAGWSASAAYKGIRPGSKTGSTQLTSEEKAKFAKDAAMYTALAAVLQTERDYEDRKVREITDSFFEAATEEVNNAEM